MATFPAMLGPEQTAEQRRFVVNGFVQSMLHVKFNDFLKAVNEAHEMSRAAKLQEFAAMPQFIGVQWGGEK